MAADRGSGALTVPGERHVMLVEDHASLRQVLVATLEMLGFRVSAYASGTEALAALESGVALDLLLTDVRMAGVPDGLALAVWVREHRPGTPVLLQTGYTRLPTDGFPVLQKPFTPDELRRALASLLGDPA